MEACWLLTEGILIWEYFYGYLDHELGGDICPQPKEAAANELSSVDKNQKPSTLKLYKAMQHLSYNIF